MRRCNAPQCPLRTLPPMIPVLFGSGFNSPMDSPSRSPKAFLVTRSAELPLGRPMRTLVRLRQPLISANTSCLNSVLSGVITQDGRLRVTLEWQSVEAEAARRGPPKMGT